MPLLRSVALLAVSLVSPIRAVLAGQFAIGAGLTVPTGDFANAARPGWMLAGGYSPWRSGSGALRLWLQGYYGENATEYQDSSGGHRLAMAGVGLSLKPSPRAAGPAPYLIGATGYLRCTEPDRAEGALYVGGGAGVAFGRSWVQARYQRAELKVGSLGFFLVAAGTSF
jgi:hypothetical protein